LTCGYTRVNSTGNREVGIATGEAVENEVLAMRMEMGSAK
jgi:hypothetical protein